ncbi:hypothetical protein M501DRAFT_90387 [Patellaria atrata CBS 101060]|uniref:Uncharacterized protein n=1 Tax=Patellaria atrata CBS 101060 TaxID=1346257 RepID=A0A9P4VRZ8_9PEZI|nr:hypothetical protein M501DRAFT_90387 [Patellaria atrata CBS 101060]
MPRPGLGSLRTLGKAMFSACIFTGTGILLGQQEKVKELVQRSPPLPYFGGTTTITTTPNIPTSSVTVRSNTTDTITQMSFMAAQSTSSIKYVVTIAAAICLPVESPRSTRVCLPDDRVFAEKYFCPWINNETAFLSWDSAIPAAESFATTTYDLHKPSSIAMGEPYKDELNYLLYATVVDLCVTVGNILLHLWRGEKEVSLRKITINKVLRFLLSFLHSILMLSLRLILHRLSAYLRPGSTFSDLIRVIITLYHVYEFFTAVKSALSYFRGIYTTPRSVPKLPNRNQRRAQAQIARKRLRRLRIAATNIAIRLSQSERDRATAMANALEESLKKSNEAFNDLTLKYSQLASGFEEYKFSTAEQLKERGERLRACATAEQRLVESHEKLTIANEELSSIKAEMELVKARKAAEVAAAVKPYWERLALSQKSTAMTQAQLEKCELELDSTQNRFNHAQELLDRINRIYPEAQELSKQFSEEREDADNEESDEEYLDVGGISQSKHAFSGRLESVRQWDDRTKRMRYVSRVVLDKDTSKTHQVATQTGVDPVKTTSKPESSNLLAPEFDPQATVIGPVPIMVTKDGVSRPLVLPLPAWWNPNQLEQGNAAASASMTPSLAPNPVRVQTDICMSTSTSESASSAPVNSASPPRMAPGVATLHSSPVQVPTTPSSNSVFDTKGMEASKYAIPRQIPQHKNPNRNENKSVTLSPKANDFTPARTPVETAAPTETEPAANSNSMAAASLRSDTGTPATTPTTTPIIAPAIASAHSDKPRTPVSATPVLSRGLSSSRFATPIASTSPTVPSNTNTTSTTPTLNRGMAASKYAVRSTAVRPTIPSIPPPQNSIRTTGAGIMSSKYAVQIDPSPSISARSSSSRPSVHPRGRGWGNNSNHNF